MTVAHSAVDAAIAEADRLRRTLKKYKSPQVRSSEERSLIKATALTWFRTHRPKIGSVIDQELLEPIDSEYKEILGSSDRAGMRSRYDSSLKTVRKALSSLRIPTLTSPTKPAIATGDDVPDFSLLIADENMQSILRRRWLECVTCVRGGAPLAATVMMGGLLEALLLARVHREPNKSLIFQATRSPKDKKSGKPLSLQDWTLKHYIDVAHELRWISHAAGDVGVVLRDYRNYVHPYKELSHGIQLEQHDAALFWEISKSISRELLKVEAAP